MKPERNARRLLGITSAKAKMWEYHVPVEDHIHIEDEPAKLFDFAIGSLGDLAATVNGEDSIPGDQPLDLTPSLRFAAKFFDSYRNSKLNPSLDALTTVSASASFYLSDMPGSSLVLAKWYGENGPDLGCRGLEKLLIWLLRDDEMTDFDGSDGPYGGCINDASRLFLRFRQTGQHIDNLLKSAAKLRELAYEKGSPRELLFADVISAVIRKKAENSAWYCLPLRSGISLDDWRPFLKKETSVRELWPSQRVLGDHGLYEGKSAVVQMPTSVGKTKATELIIRSAFLSGRAATAIIVAPFRALCHEISNSLSISFSNEPVDVNELSDVIQTDFSIDFSKLDERRQVIVVTPEKLLYVLRHEPMFASQIGLVILDEAHLFDDATRGVNYELLLSSLRKEIPQKSQTVLVSAVIRNASQVAGWLLRNDKAVVADSQLTPTDRSIAYVTWTRRLGQLYFPVLENVQDYEFFVPRILETHSLSARTKGFPDKERPNEVALYLGLRLVENGALAIFCGRKDTAALICRTAVRVFDGRLPVTAPSTFSQEAEIIKLGNLIEKNLGRRSDMKQSADLGIFPHHGNVPHGIRLSIEYALEQGFIKYVVCTSTLAQGVNLPIRYLIVASVYQGWERIKTRDFHNLIGRAGRAGKHTEGSILFADPKIYDRRVSIEDGWRWRQANELLDPSNSEDCTSAIAEIFEPIYNDRHNRYIVAQPLDLAQMYLKEPNEFLSIAERIVEHHDGYTKDRIVQQLAEKLTAIRAIQSYLLAHADEWEDNVHAIDELVEGTLAYALADEQAKQNLKELFHLLRNDIEVTVPDSPTRHVFGVTLLGLRECVDVEGWVIENIDSLHQADEEDELTKCIWSLLSRHIRNRSFTRCNPSKVLQQVYHEWLAGSTYHHLFHNYLQSARLGSGLRPRRFLIENAVDLCENGFGYDGALVAGAVAEIASLYSASEKLSLLSDRLSLLQKRLKYGLPSAVDVTIYEIGFSDRVLCQEIRKALKIVSSDRRTVLSTLRKRSGDLRNLLSVYPSYYSHIMDSVLADKQKR